MQIIGSLFHDYFSMSVQLYSHWIMFPLYFQHLFEKLFKTQNKLHCTNANKSHRAFFIFVLWNKGTHSLFKTYSIIMYSNLPLIKDETSMFVWVQCQCQWLKFLRFFTPGRVLFSSGGSRIFLRRRIIKNFFPTQFPTTISWSGSWSII